MKASKNTGFSLIELIIVIAIMAILIGVLAPQYIKYVEKSKVSADEDTADTLLSTAYLMASDDDYFPNINVGNKIIFGSTGISLVPTGDPTMTSAMNEYVNNWQNAKVKSKTYSTRQYVVEFQGGALGNTFQVTGGWQP